MVGNGKPLKVFEQGSPLVRMRTLVTGVVLASGTEEQACHGSEVPQCLMSWARGRTASGGRQPRGGSTTETWGNEIAGEEPVMEMRDWPMQSGGQED